MRATTVRSREGWDALRKRGTRTGRLFTEEAADVQLDARGEVWPGEIGERALIPGMHAVGGMPTSRTCRAYLDRRYAKGDGCGTNVNAVELELGCGGKDRGTEVNKHMEIFKVAERRDNWSAKLHQVSVIAA